MKRVALTTGILLALSAYSILQERLIASTFDGDRFTFPVLLVLANRTTACLAAAARLVGRRESFRTTVPFQKFLIVAGFNIIATSCQYEALRHISVPWQALCKASKMVAVMLWGILIGQKQYTGADWMTAASVTSGCSLFLAGGSPIAASASRHSSIYGLTLMVGYLASDGFTASFQDRLFRSHDVSSFTQALYVNLCSIIISSAGLATSGQFVPAVAFMRGHPLAACYMLCLSVAASSGQFCIVETIKRYGALYLALVMTLRQFISISASSWIFRHNLNTTQWCGIVLTFGSLLGQKVWRHAGPKKRI